MKSVRLRLAAALAALNIMAASLSSQALDAQASPEALAAVRARIRSEAGVDRDWRAREGSGVVWRFEESEMGVEGEGEDIPMMPFTVLPGDTVMRLAVELTGTEEAAAIIRAVIPDPRPGDEFLLPTTLLTPAFSDPELVTVALDQKVPTLAALVDARLTAPRVEAPRTIRNLMRLNGFQDTARVGKGTGVTVPAALLRRPPQPGRLELRSEYALDPGVKTSRKGSPRARKAPGTTQLFRQVEAVELVVVHTTEHSATSLESVASHIRRNALANYLIGPRGEVYAIVPEGYVANGCGESLWEGRREVNQRAINVEIYADTAATPKYTGISSAQYEGLRKLLADISARRPNIHKGRVVTHAMVAVSYKYGWRSRKGDPYEFDWEKAGLPNNAQKLDQDVLLGRVSLCRDRRFADRITPGQTAAAAFLSRM